MNLFTQKITPFLILGLLVVVIGIPYGIYQSRQDSTGIGTAVLVIAVLITAALVTLDRLAVRHVPSGGLWIIELVILVVTWTYYNYNNRTVLLDLSENPAPYFVLIWTNDTPETPVPASRFPFDKVVAVPTGTVAQLNHDLFLLTTVKAPAHWNGGQYSFGIKLTHPRFESAYFYGPEEYQYKHAEVDSLVRQAVARQ